MRSYLEKTKRRKDSLDWEQILLFAVLLFGIASRWWNIQRLGLWSDELYSSFYSKYFEYAPEDNHTPFFYFFTRLFASVLGWTEMGLRCFPLVTSTCLSIFLFFQARYERGEAKKIATWFFLFVIFSPLEWILSREARMYEWMFALSTLSLLFGLSFLKFEGRRNLVLFAVALTLNTFNHATCAAFGLSLCAYLSLRSKIEKGRLGPYLWIFTLSIFPTWSYYSGNIKNISESFAKISWVTPPTVLWPFQLFELYAGIKYPYFDSQIPGIDRTLFLLCLLLILGFTLASFRQSGPTWKSRLKSFVVSPLGLILPCLFYHFLFLLILPLTSFFNPSYFISLCPLLLYIWAWIFSNLPKFRIPLKFAFLNYFQPLGVMIGFIFFALGFNFQYRNLLSPKSGIREYNRDFFQQAGGGDFLVDCDYLKLTLGIHAAYPTFDPEKTTYCFGLKPLLALKSLPKRIKIYRSTQKFSDIALAETFLSQNYSLTERIILPPEGTVLETRSLLSLQKDRSD